ncbi:MAG TPA: hypothetical protein PLH72_10860 [Vicinamibacterales bacterium]|nr:hypothetical protein [Vicinamibacterales bacterium]
MLTAVVSLGASLVVFAAGFVRLVTGLQAGGSGTRTELVAYGLLGLGGGLLALGVALLIWEMSGRHNIRR